MVQKNKSILNTLENLLEQINEKLETLKEKIYIIPAIAGLIYLFLFGEYISAIGFFLVALSKNFNNNGLNIKSVVLLLIGTVLFIIGSIL
jgi:hypothetical protein